jgi:hypothetical protein
MKSILDQIKLPVLLLLICLVFAGSELNAQTHIWKGTISDQWNLAANWSANSIPTALSTVSISAVGQTVLTNVTVLHSPVITTTNGLCKSLTLEAGGGISGAASLTVAPTNTITVKGTSVIACPLIISGTTTFNITTLLTLSGSLSGSGDIKTQTGVLTLSSSINFNKLTITSGTVNMGSGSSTLTGIVMSAANSTLNLNGTTTVNGLIQMNKGTLYIGSNTLISNAGINTFLLGVISGSSSSNLTLNGTVGESINFNAPGGEELSNLTLNHSASVTTTINTDLIIYKGISFTSINDNLDFTGQHVTLKSLSSGTAYIGEVKGGLLGATNVTVERYIDGTLNRTGKRSWRLLSIPLIPSTSTIRDLWAGAAANPAAPAGETNYNIGTLITGHHYANGDSAALHGFDWFTGLDATTTSSIRYYNNTTYWASATNTPSPLNPPDKQGYMLYVRGDRTVASSVDTGYTTLTPTGELNIGTVTVPVGELYTVVGNPYTSALDLDLMYNNSGNSNTIEQNFWVWDAWQGRSGGYVSISYSGGAYQTTGGDGTSNYLIANSGQAFFVQMKSAGNIDIMETNKSTATPPVTYRPVGNTGVSSIVVKLSQATGLRCDAVRARYSNSYNVAPNEIYDAAKLNNFNENLSLVRNNTYLSVESRPYPTQSDTLYLPFWGLTIRDYSFQIIASDFVGINQTARLIDAFTNTETPLDLNDGTITYPFSVTANAASSSLNRFKIVMTPVVVLPVSFTNIKANLNGGKIKVLWNTGTELNVKNYEVEKSADGINFAKVETVAAQNAAANASYQWLDEQPFNGKNFYRIRSVDKSGKYAFSSIVLVQADGKKGIQVFPTVVDNKRFNLLLNQQNAGDYNLTLSNAAGQQVYHSKIVNTRGNNSYSVDLSNTVLSKGVYHLSVDDENGNIKSFRILINN